MLSIPSLGTEIGVVDIMEFHMASLLQSFPTEFSFALLEDDSIVMHATINADRDLHADAFDVEDTSFLPKLYLIYARSDCAILPTEGVVEARELATLNRPGKGRDLIVSSEGGSNSESLGLWEDISMYTLGFGVIIYHSYKPFFSQYLPNMLYMFPSNRVKIKSLL